MKTQTPPKTLILTGPTASGKTALAIEMCLQVGDIEIINADSMLVYRGMTIGTAKPSIDEQRGILHHLVDIRDPHEEFTAGDFVELAHAAVSEIQAKGKRALIVGGTGFYLKALLFGLWSAPRADRELREYLEGLGPEELFQRLETRDLPSAIRIGRGDTYRLVRALELIELTGQSPTELQAQVPSQPHPAFELWVVDRDGAELEERIAVRTSQMLNHGLIEEVESLRAQSPNARGLAAVGYAQTLDYLKGIVPKGRKIPPGITGLEQEIKLATRQLVKRQRTWFKGQTQGRRFKLDRDRAMIISEFQRFYSSNPLSLEFG